MKTTEYLLFNNDLTIPILAPNDIQWPTLEVGEFKTYCGAGDGFGDAIVPDTLWWGVVVSPACFVHDYMWDKARPTWADFHVSNSIFLHNLISLIDRQSKNRFLKRLRLYRAVTYYNAVDSIGKKIFWRCKNNQKKIAETP